jgi:hypothetical protein
VPGRVNGFSLAYTATGAVVLWSGIKGWSISETFKQLLSGKTPAASTEQITTTSAETTASGTDGIFGGGDFAAPSGSGSSSSGRSAMLQAAKAYGWNTGAEWTALVYVEMREAGFSATAKNASSGALGMAQALGHGTSGTAGTLGNEYGGYGLSDSQAKLANSGNAYWQAVWMCNYIKATYGDPIAAANHERSHNWY